MTLPNKVFRIAVIGPGGIGSTCAFKLSQAGHEVTVVARGRRLERLRQDEAIVTTAGRRAAVVVTDQLDTSVAYDLVLVTVLAKDTEELLPTLRASSARAIAFLYNTFRSLEPLREAVGAERAVFGLAGVVAGIENGLLSFRILRRGQSTTVSSRYWAEVFTAAGLPARTQPDIQSWLRTHTAVLVPMVVAAHTADQRGRGISRPAAIGLAQALHEGLHLVRTLGNRIVPRPLAVLERLPVPILAGIWWSATRVPAFRTTLRVAPASEPAALIEEMVAASPHPLPALQALSPT